MSLLASQCQQCQKLLEYVQELYHCTDHRFGTVDLKWNGSRLLHSGKNKLSYGRSQSESRQFNLKVSRFTHIGTNTETLICSVSAVLLISKIAETRSSYMWRRNDHRTKDPSTVFFIFLLRPVSKNLLTPLEKITNKEANFQRDLLKTKEDLDQQNCEILQMFVWWRARTRSHSTIHTSAKFVERQQLRVL